jgi:nitrogen regulatory protein PII
MEKMLVLIYNTALEKVVIEYIDECGITCYTRIPKVYGRGKTGGPRMGTHIWPGENEMLWIVTEEEKVSLMLECAKKLKAEHKGKGVKAFVLPVEAKI